MHGRKEFTVAGFYGNCPVCGSDNLSQSQPEIIDCHNCYIVLTPISIIEKEKKSRVVLFVRGYHFQYVSKKLSEYIVKTKCFNGIEARGKSPALALLSLEYKIKEYLKEKKIRCLFLDY
jgi:hypothetical protein